MDHTIKNEALTVTVSGRGAQLLSVLGADGTQYLWQGDPKYWSNRALTIFPFVARLTGGSYSLDGRSYRLPIHGLAPYCDFAAAENNGVRLVLELQSDAGTLEQYPREFTFRVVYELSGGTLAVAYEVVNRDTRPMIFGLGGHPGFNVPLTRGLRFEDYRLRFPAPCRPTRVGFTPDCFVSGEDAPWPLKDGRFIPLSHSLFDEDAVVLRDMCREVTLESPLDGHSVTVAFPQMPYLGLWHMPKTDAPYVCIEPWLSLPANAGEATVFEDRPDLARLAPGETYRNEWSIAVKQRKDP